MAFARRVPRLGALAVLASPLALAALAFLRLPYEHPLGSGARARLRIPPLRALQGDLGNLRKRELIEMLTSQNVDAAGLTKPELLQRLLDLDGRSTTVKPSMSQRQVAEIAMDDWQNATTVGFDCKSGRHTADGVEFDIIGPTGMVEHTTRFSTSWPPTCTCPDARQWGSQLRCKHVCMILVKCGVPYAAVADDDWKPGEMEIQSIVHHMKGQWSPIPLQALTYGSVHQDDAARDFAEGLLGSIWSLRYAKKLPQSFLLFAQTALQQLAGRSSAAPCVMPTGRFAAHLDTGSEAVPKQLQEMPGAFVIHKPAGWCVDQGEESLVEADEDEKMNYLSSFVSTLMPTRRCTILSDKLYRRGFLHRLDVPTSGLILAATTHDVFYDLRLQLACGSFVRDYQVLCHGWLRGRNHVQAAIHWVSDGRTTSSTISRFGRPSFTWMRLSASFLVTSQVLSLFLMRIATGRKHQIRVHSAHVGHAVVCDGRYSTTSTYHADLKWCPRNFLHRSRLCFTINHRTIDIEQRLPADLTGALRLCIQRESKLAELSRPYDKAAEVLGKIAQIRAERQQRDKDFAILQDIIGPTPPPPPEPSRRMTLVLRKIPVISLKYHRTRIGSLCYFASIGDAPSVKYLLEQARRGGDDFFVNSVDDEVCRRTALHYCAIEGNVEVSEALLQAGADVFLRDREDRTPLHLAAAMGQVGVARQLLGTCLSRIREAMLQRFRSERLEPADPWEDPSMADQRAAKRVMAEYLQVLEETRRHLCLSEDRHQFTCLHYAVRDAYAGRFQILKLVLGSFFEFPRGRETDSIMTNKLFEIQPGPGLLKLLSGFLLEEEVAELQETVNHALQSVSYILDPSLARSHPARGSRLASLPLSRLRRAAR
ncbi:Ribosomal large subunit pseudouridine synthase D [Symbiodinium microadriaticum]|uniref:Ribosomal large subunit pseudouridine synthase D n=1 Tax=Symbiodinium microadriaticum TaxID=2951 RepID=A0A1Q9DNW9_SYMMI|nr:Ribosomal large subunit pseudouridine synthase D [Symbiodinium microadriaticum]